MVLGDVEIAILGAIMHLDDGPSFLHDNSEGILPITSVTLKPDLERYSISMFVNMSI